MSSHRSPGSLLRFRQGEAERGVLCTSYECCLSHEQRTEVSCQYCRNAEGIRAVVWLWVWSGDLGHLLSVREDLKPERMGMEIR